MLKTILWFIYFVFSLLYTIPALLKVQFLNRQNRINERDEITHRTAQRWARMLVNLSGSQIKVMGEENVPKEGAVLFVSNHQSNFDIPILLGFIHKPKSFIAKKELSRIPILSTWMKYMQCVFIDREDARQSLKAINRGAELLKEGYSQVIFPEGTRSADGRLGEFKPGSLKLALKANVPIVPVTIKGAYHIMPKGQLKIQPAQVEVIISPPIQVGNISAKESGELAEKVRKVIGEKL
ncbi:lysophospholipid acyltransferase family protein [Thermotalea metallivorans]|uniref:1-acyl-sn-glycerol-3-phosphate acyltransferase n=1 Tax=Thermotalea metallivorans TaxID=520762 RepID=A0A140L372_9FIRM|nr:lysophospholipid acyltransferase family protein [Thermotalea metallivorans]KXG74997.1 1-acyl-sn-glycerol-3-phosphate acyltransferase [Thermotalea metallivorans]